MNKKQLWLLVILLFAGVALYAQVPKAINYQAVAYGEDGNALANKQITVKLAILQGGAEGVAVYDETHEVRTADNGVFNLQIGTGTIVSGAFSSIDWSQSPYYVQFSLDTQGGSSYRKVATSQMLSVPYALYAERAGSVEGGSGSVANPFAHQFLAMPINGPAARFLTGLGEAEPTQYNDLYIFVAYLDGEDQEVEYEITGLPVGVTYDNEYGSVSGPSGRALEVQIEHSSSAPAGTYHCNYILKNKYGVTKSYPFVYKVKAGDTDQADTYAKEQLAELFTAFRTYEAFSASLDQAFMSGTSAEYASFADKTYGPDDETVKRLWNDGYAILTKCLDLKSNLGRGNTASVSTAIFSQCAAIEAYIHFILTQWFGDIPSMDNESNRQSKVARIEILEECISAFSADLTETSFGLSGEFTNEEFNLLLREAKLLKGDFSDVAAMEAMDGIQSFIKEIANWKLNNGEVEEETTASSLMTEYMDTYHSTYKRGNLYLNILGCSATYFSWNVDQAYKALLPIPQSALDVNENLTQNPGY